ncbi:mannose-1-phosphate guanylyltransferase/mannose-6-phosphate isomerase [Acinetobacter pseudolwoffii]|uniref:mannose-1-phosphate guanylyltransferase/mannose-6-phosphate isomerase n=1 Tax=Acinetobacter pseudolwoffii TaxID=2053287 RepID=UPI0025759E5D|nr:mannose-1-phosphate guanylyltransferase/mannose-6-phosphate isomerase [Acinetobacter pseudolwoffii]MDM1344498.1 mannose-1-phosphate guanylyltransferase/mannose-6-phosphate isomerase [Acinetobacter pseudolwoffii]
MIVPIVLAGGSGTRLWPLSRQSYPKQFLHLVDQQYTMLQLTLKRLENFSLQVLPPIIVCNENHRFIVAEQLRQINIQHASIILEPCAKNTAPAITLAALQAQELYPDQNLNLLVLSADNYIADLSAFHHSIVLAEQQAQLEQLVVFGVTPTEPHTGYGYIQLGRQISENCAYKLDQFVEKPDLQTAEHYISSKNYLWNSGIFMFQVSLFLQELKIYQSDIYKFCLMAWQQKTKDLDFIRIGLQEFQQCLENSIDYAIMEKTTKGVVVCFDVGWNDLGSWSSLWQSNQKDENQNVLFGDVLAEQSQRNYIYSSSRLVTALGVENLIIVETKDAVLIAHQDKSQEIKKIVEQLKSEQRIELLQHREIIRPWGKYDCIDIGQRYQVKRITVNAKAKLSMQLHHHRAEHWVVVKGTAKVTNGEKQYYVTENESTFIPLGTVHSLENPGCIPLELIEIQSGSYLGEDDIVRLKDNYGRI